MDFLSFLTITLSTYLGILIIITLHEFGHAIPAALFTKQKITVFLGSHGAEENNLKFNIGLIDFKLNYKLWTWRGGLCVPSGSNLTFKQQIIFFLSGPIFPILILVLPVYISTFFNLNEYLVAGFYILLLLSIFLCLGNLVPFTRTTNNGRVLLSDGYQLRWILSNRRFYNDYITSIQAYNNKDYKKTADILSDIIVKGAKGQFYTDFFL